VKTEEVIAKAREYLLYEEDVFFRNQVTSLPERNDLDELNNHFFTDPPASLAGTRVAFIRDYSDGTTRYLSEGMVKKDISFPSSNVIQFVLEDESIITERPSGSEPKIKCCASCRSRPNTPLGRARRDVGEKINSISTAINALITGA
jgi:phosphoglucomutase